MENVTIPSLIAIYNQVGSNGGGAVLFPIATTTTLVVVGEEGSILTYYLRLQLQLREWYRGEKSI